MIEMASSKTALAHFLLHHCEVTNCIDFLVETEIYLSSNYIWIIIMLDICFELDQNRETVKKRNNGTSFTEAQTVFAKKTTS
jgi:hypothetical protein